MESNVTLNQIETLTEQWQSILRLNDWNITVELVPHLGSYGETMWDRYKNACIRLCTLDTLPPQPVGCGDIAVTLVHELLHLHASKLTKNIEPDSPEDDALEEMIEILAQTFIGLRRALAASQKPAKKLPKKSPIKKAARNSSPRRHRN